MEISEVKVEAGRGDWEREVRPWKVTVKYPSDGQFNGKAGKKEKKEGRSRERAERKIGCSTREKERERTVCSLDRIIAGGSGLTSSRITSTSPRTLLVLFIAPCFAVIFILFVYCRFLCVAIYSK